MEEMWTAGITLDDYDGNEVLQKTLVANSKLGLWRNIYHYLNQENLAVLVVHDNCGQLSIYCQEI